ncbi:methionine aminopeptidase, type II [Staphylothermus marinus F1]|uniref:Methionine aminopeptidase n=1 Tax=Staphylothermus marinus (strain ATCC 43588 / DSM 3639 / JCM 9404 / F1) TaxID=399550 RepID=A3DMY2_STAMF|nr:type II methionyl aminopeptidase [Staphylothermus marinus]ABN69992.1 methionine aminopeptidase, type II [Staphylothermus marinus F1]
MSLSEEAISKLLKAGEIAKKVREEAARIAEPGMKLFELAEYVERRIRELGGEPAFPVNLSINEVAAHYTPVVDDNTIIPDNAVLKIDLGVHIDGYIADTSVTVAFNPVYESLLEASRMALEKALEIVGPGIRVNTIGKVIEETITSYGYKPIRNLSGHSIDRYLIHAGKSIPNYNDLFTRWKLVEGVYAIEPFATNGVGLVREGPIATIYSLTPRRRTHLTLYEKKLFDKIWSERRTLPFCERWYVGLFNSVEGLRNTLRMMQKHRVIYAYPVLIERGGGLVSQFEHTFIIHGKDVIVTTK